MAEIKKAGTRRKNLQTKEDAYPGTHGFHVEEITSFSLRRKNDGIRKTVLPEYSPSRLITYSVFKVTGQVNTTL